MGLADGMAWEREHGWMTERSADISALASSRDANDIIGDANNRYMRNKDPGALAEAYQLAAEWHDSQAATCSEIAKDEPRLGADIRAKAEVAATHHGASAAGLRIAATQLLRTK